MGSERSAARRRPSRRAGPYSARKAELLRRRQSLRSVDLPAAGSLRWQRQKAPHWLLSSPLGIRFERVGRRKNPPGQSTIRTPLLIMQGSRGPYGNKAEAECRYPLSASVQIVEVDTDHEFFIEPGQWYTIARRIWQHTELLSSRREGDPDQVSTGTEDGGQATTKLRYHSAARIRRYHRPRNCRRSPRKVSPTIRSGSRMAA